MHLVYGDVSVRTFTINFRQFVQVIFRLSEPLVQATSDSSPTPSEYKLTLLKEEQSRAVFSEAVKPGMTGLS